jgi:hypothetical protein
MSNKLVVLFTMLPYTAFILWGIHHYEAKIKSYKESIGDYKRALNLAKHHSNAEHYTHLQLTNQSLSKTVRELDTANYLLQQEVKALKGKVVEFQAGESQGMQYESSIYKNNQWESNVYANQTELEIDPLFESMENFE